MKPPIFAYERADSIAHAASLLRQNGEDARLIAGGQSLMASLNFRLSQPSVLVDITRIEALRGIRAGEDAIELGALTRHNEILRSRDVASAAPLLTAAAPHIAHEAIRNRGTIGGSLAFADPAAEWPACALALDAEILVAGEGGARQVSATSFFRDLYETALEPAELVSAIRFPRRDAEERHCFLELARRHGDYAIVGLASVATWRDGMMTNPRLAFFGVGAKPVLATGAMAELDGTAAETRDVERACEALTAELQPFDDPNASADMRRHLARTLLGRAVVALKGEGRDA